MSVKRLPVSDPALPIDPEAVARSLGSALSSRHGAGRAPTASVDDPDRSSFSLQDLTAHLVAASARRGGTVSTGSFEGLDLRELAASARRAVESLPRVQAPVLVRLGLTLDDCMISPQGDVEVAGETVWGDRHLDLAAVAVGVAVRFGSAVVAPLVDAYGADDVDLLTLDACQQLNAIAAEVGWPDA